MDTAGNDEESDAEGRDRYYGTAQPNNAISGISGFTGSISSSSSSSSSSSGKTHTKDRKANTNTNQKEKAQATSTRKGLKNGFDNVTMYVNI